MTEQKIFIDKFFIPKAGINEFMERMNLNRKFLRTLEGFIEDSAYTNMNNEGDLNCLTIAVWENESVLEKAKIKVQATYKEEGFNMNEMFSRLNISMDRAIYSKLE